MSKDNINITTKLNNIN